MRLLFFIMILLSSSCFSQKSEYRRYDEMPKKPKSGNCYMKVRRLSDIHLSRKTYPVFIGSDSLDIELDTISILMESSLKGYDYKENIDPCDDEYKDCKEILYTYLPEKKKEVVVVKDLSDPSLYENKEIKTIRYEKPRKEFYWQEMDCFILDLHKVPLTYEGDSLQFSDTNESTIKDTLIWYLRRMRDVCIEIKMHTRSYEDWEFAKDLSEKRLQKLIAFLKSKGIRRDRIIGYGMGDALGYGDMFTFKVIQVK